MSHRSTAMDGSLGLSLGGIVGVLRAHATAPHLFVRELLRLAAGSVAARAAAEPSHAGEIHFQLVEPPGGGAPTLLVEDNGIGLSEEEVLGGLATLGGFSRATVGAFEGDASNGGRIANPSAPAALANGRFGKPSRGEDVDGSDLISRLGLGIVTCFAVADEVRVLTRSLDRGTAALEWVGRADGSYTLRQLDYSMQPGTQIYLRPRADCRSFFEPAALRAAVTQYGEFLPHPLVFSHGGQRMPLNGTPPWRSRSLSPHRDEGGPIDSSSCGQDIADLRTWRRSQLATARRLLGEEFLDAVPVRWKSGRGDAPSHVGGGIEGVVLIPTARSSLLRRAPQRVYHRGLLLAEEATNLLPDWAGMFACIVHVRDLHPTILFDGLREDRRLARVRRALGRSLHASLAEMAEREPERWRRIVDVHRPTMKLLAAEHEEFFRLFIDLLPFESATGRASLAELARRHLSVHYVGSRRRPAASFAAQLADLAGALGLGVVFATDEQEAALLEKASRRAAAAPLRELHLAELARHLSDLESRQQRAATPFLDLADDILRPLGCAIELRHFGTQRMLALLLTPDVAAASADAASADTAPAIPATDPASTAYAQLWLNFDHPMVRQLLGWSDPEAIAKALRLIYAHAKLTCTGEVDRTGAKLLFEGLRDSLEG